MHWQTLSRGADAAYLHGGIIREQLTSLTEAQLIAMELEANCRLNLFEFLGGFGVGGLVKHFSGEFGSGAAIEVVRPTSLAESAIDVDTSLLNTFSAINQVKDSINDLKIPGAEKGASTTQIIITLLMEKNDMELETFYQSIRLMSRARDFAAGPTAYSRSDVERLKLISSAVYIPSIQKQQAAIITGQVAGFVWRLPPLAKLALARAFHLPYSEAYISNNKLEFVITMTSGLFNLAAVLLVAKGIVYGYNKDNPFNYHLLITEAESLVHFSRPPSSANKPIEKSLIKQRIKNDKSSGDPDY